MTERNTFPLGTLIIGGLFLLVMLITYLLVKPSPPPAELEGILRAQFTQLRPFQLSGSNGQAINEKNFQGKWSFVFFGYVSCPDVCPTTLQQLDSMQRLLKDENSGSTSDLQIIFVSLDPQRDSLQRLGEYVAYFNKNFIGATADKRLIDSFSRQFGAGYVIEPETAPGQYLVAHSSAIFLVDPLGRLVASIPQPHYASDILSQYKKLKAYIEAKG